jgi:hypothetical protein
MNISELERHAIKLDSLRYVTWTRYYNANYYAAAIVATITVTGENTKSPNGPGEIIDWSAYMGGTDGTKREEEAVRHIAEYTGCKLTPQDAYYFFPELADEWYRT